MPIENTKNDALKYQNTYYKKILTVTQGCQMLFLDLLLRPGGQGIPPPKVIYLPGYFCIPNTI